MRIHLLAIGTRMPLWAKQGYLEYASRMPKECTLVLQELPTVKRSKGGGRQPANSAGKQAATGSNSKK